MKVFIFIIVILLIKCMFSQPLVEDEWLESKICKDNFKIIEVGLSYNSYMVEHIQCARFTNFYKDGWRINKKGINMVLPSAQNISKILENLNIERNDHVVLYAKKNTTYSVAETTAIYFTLKYLGHKKVSILNGGYPEFKKNFSLLIEEGENLSKKRSIYNFKINKNIKADYKNILFNQENDFFIVDARETDFFLGINKLKNFKGYGTINKSINIPSKWFLEARGLKFNKLDVIENIFEIAKVSNKSNLIFFCYSGLESSLNWFVSSELMKNKNSRLYEGSIFDWVDKNKELF